MISRHIGETSGQPTVRARLLGRTAERQALDQLIGSVQDGVSATMVLVGEAGIGKTTLLDYAAQSAGSLQLARAAGVEYEMQLDFAALHQLLLPFLDRIGGLPEPQREAMRTAFGLLAGPPPDRLRVGLATLTLLADVASEGPLLCLIDDGQWLDRESLDVLAFVCRRLQMDGIGVVVAMRENGEHGAVLETFRTHRILGMPPVEAHQLLATRVGRLPRQLERRIVSETGGNPLALLEVVGGLSTAQLAGTGPLPHALPVGSRLESLFLAQVKSLPARTQSLLLLVSMAPRNGSSVVWRAAAALGLDEADADAAVAAGILETGTEPVFRHPLIRAAVYSGADAAERRHAHSAMASATDAGQDRDRRAWHLSAAAVGPDERIAAEMEEAAEGGRRRGGYTAQAALLLRAAELSPDPATRAVRLFASARAELRAGNLRAAQLRLQQAQPTLVEPLLQAAASRAEAFLEFAFGRLENVPALLLQAAAKAAPSAPAAAREILFEAMVTAIIGHSSQHGWTLVGVARAALDSLHNPPAENSVGDLLMAGLATRHALSHEQAAPLLQKALVALCTEDLPLDTNLSWAIPGSFAAAELWDDCGRKALLQRLIAGERHRGDLNSLHNSLRRFVRCDISEGDFAAAQSHHAEASEISVAIGMPDYGFAMRGELLAWQGKEAELRGICESVFAGTERAKYTSYGNLVRYSMTLLELSLGRYAQAQVWALPLYEDDAAPLSNAALPELIEAAVRAGNPALAGDALARLGRRVTASGTDWGLGILARCQALIADDRTADGLYREALELLDRSLQRTESARTHLLYGEWLRRARRRGDARVELRTAHDLFSSMGARLFAERARKELLATGERARQRSMSTPTELTPQEDQVARLAAGGHTNAEVATRLFITTSTVEYHLNKVFRKLDLTSRRQLARALGDNPETRT